MQALLTFAAMNLKKLAKWKKINGLFIGLFRFIPFFYLNYTQNTIRA
jgi:hypothetical protein